MKSIGRNFGKGVIRGDNFVQCVMCPLYTIDTIDMSSVHKITIDMSIKRLLYIICT